ncbi:MAG: hypothetical protein PHO79_03435 [Desulfoplanes sp.]|nr:hypothetical protein [Desulfoplanes sp.]MDD4649055.1 hypothetical protein [Desulfoplanes sp.]
MAGKNLIRVHSYSFPSTNLMYVDIMLDRERPPYKPGYFVFLNAAPGRPAPGSSAGRTFALDEHMTMKISPFKLASLVYAVRCYAAGTPGKVGGKFIMYTDSSKSSYVDRQEGAKKSVMLTYGQEQSENKDVVPPIQLRFKAGQDKPIVITCTPAEAMALAGELADAVTRCHDLEFQRSLKLAKGEG